MAGRLLLTEIWEVQGQSVVVCRSMIAALLFRPSDDRQSYSSGTCCSDNQRQICLATSLNYSRLTSSCRLASRHWPRTRTNLMRMLSTLRWVFALLYCLNYKQTLFVWHFRFLYTCLRGIVLYKYKFAKAAHSNKLEKQSIWTTHKITGRASLGDLDYNIHKSNSTYECTFIT